MPYIQLQTALTKLKNHTEMQFELNYDKGSELFVCIAVTLLIDQQNNKKSSFYVGYDIIVNMARPSRCHMLTHLEQSIVLN
jgi:hypothetical protein